jgi:hypothetical protein
VSRSLLIEQRRHPLVQEGKVDQFVNIMQSSFRMSSLSVLFSLLNC